jgi:hypothetical protein
MTNQATQEWEDAIREKFVAWEKDTGAYVSALMAEKDYEEIAVQFYLWMTEHCPAAPSPSDEKFTSGKEEAEKAVDQMFRERASRHNLFYANKTLRSSIWREIAISLCQRAQLLEFEKEKCFKMEGTFGHEPHSVIIPEHAGTYAQIGAQMSEQALAHNSYLSPVAEAREAGIEEAAKCVETAKVAPDRWHGETTSADAHKLAAAIRALKDSHPATKIKSETQKGGAH